jgi:hypothetical protein
MKLKGRGFPRETPGLTAQSHAGGSLKTDLGIFSRGSFVRYRRLAGGRARRGRMAVSISIAMHCLAHAGWIKHFAFQHKEFIGQRAKDIAQLVKKSADRPHQ